MSNDFECPEDKEFIDKKIGEISAHINQLGESYGWQILPAYLIYSIKTLIDGAYEPSEFCDQASVVGILQILSNMYDEDARVTLDVFRKEVSGEGHEDEKSEI